VQSGRGNQGADRVFGRDTSDDLGQNHQPSINLDDIGALHKACFNLCKEKEA
jgi:hypothetical protein